MRFEQAVDLAERRIAVNEDIAKMCDPDAERELSVVEIEDRFEKLGERFMALYVVLGHSSAVKDDIQDRYLSDVNLARLTGGIDVFDRPERRELTLKLQAGYSIFEEDGEPVEQLQHVNTYWTVKGVTGHLAQEDISRDTVSRNPAEALRSLGLVGASLDLAERYPFSGSHPVDVEVGVQA